MLENKKNNKNNVVPETGKLSESSRVPQLVLFISIHFVTVSSIVHSVSFNESTGQAKKQDERASVTRQTQKYRNGGVTFVTPCVTLVTQSRGRDARHTLCGGRHSFSASS